MWFWLWKGTDFMFIAISWGCGLKYSQRCLPQDSKRNTLERFRFQERSNIGGTDQSRELRFFTWPRKRVHDAKSHRKMWKVSDERPRKIAACDNAQPTTLHWHVQARLFGSSRHCTELWSVFSEKSLHWESKGLKPRSSEGTPNVQP